MLDQNTAEQIVARAQASPSEIVDILEELSKHPFEDFWASETAHRVALVDLPTGVATLIALLGEACADWAADQLYLLVVAPDARPLPTLESDSERALVAALDGSAAREAALACLHFGVERERARDVLVGLISAELGGEDAYHDGAIDYDYGCGLQDMLIALRNAPLSQAVVKLHERIFPGADGPLTSVCIRSFIRRGAPADTLRRWREELESRHYSIDGYLEARLFEADFATRYAEGASVQDLVADTAARSSAAFFVNFAATQCIRALADEAGDEVLEALERASVGAPDQTLQRIEILREALSSHGT